jgi:hypothetical protein
MKKDLVAFLAGCVVVSVVLAFCAGCASFNTTDPALQPLAPPRSDTVFTRGGKTYKLTVSVYPGDAGPYCGLPDAGNEIRCEFHWGWLQTGDMTTTGDTGWETLSPPGARAACSRALFTIGTLATAEHVQTCAFLLMYIRFRDLPPDRTPPEYQ